MSVKVFLILASLICCSIANVWGMCVLHLPEDLAKRPTVGKAIGSRRVNLSHKPTFLRLQDGEHITAQCNTSFKSPSSIGGHTQIILYCRNEKLSVHPYSNSLLIECDTSTWNVYEAAQSFPWCPQSLASYILAQPTVRGEFKILAGICYSFDDMSVQTMHYVMTPKSSEYLARDWFREYVPRTKLNYIADDFGSQDIASYIYDNSQIKHLMKFAKYESHSLIQNANIFHETNMQLGGLLDVAWWSALRLGNWQLYEEALAKHIEIDDIEYDILTGVSGVVSAPIYKADCDENRTRVEVFDDMGRRMPLYVWQYLKSSRHSSDNLVVIGVNSPFYEFYNEHEIELCTNICHHIDWLHKVHTTFRYRAMGVIFCCSVEDFKAAWHSNGFLLFATESTDVAHERYSEYDVDFDNVVFVDIRRK